LLNLSHTFSAIEAAAHLDNFIALCEVTVFIHLSLGDTRRELVVCCVIVFLLG
jgi:hypothetical protein